MNELLLRRRMMAAQGGTPTPPVPHDGQLEYIETDGISYISTGVGLSTYADSVNKGISMEIKLFVPQNNDPDTIRGILGQLFTPSGSSTKLSLLNMKGNGDILFGWYYNYTSSDGVPSASWSVQNEKPFVVKSALKRNSQSIQLKEENDADFRVKSSTSSNYAYNDWNLRLFSIRDQQTSSFLTRAALQGTRIYYCKIYNDNTFTTLLRDYIPYRLNDIVGLLDNVSNTFFQNQNSDGTFIGGPNIS